MIVQSPWPHIVFDNFLHQEDFQELSTHPTSHVPADKRQSLLNNKVYADGRVESQDLSEQLIARLHQRCHERSMQWLQQLAPGKVSLYEYSDYELVITGSHCAFPVHDDTWDKLLSIVVYLAPEQNAGTIVYDNLRAENPQSMEWKQNRGLIFSRQEDTTWHAYKGDKKNNRLALVYNLMTTDMRGVYRAEEKSLAKARLKRGLSKIGKFFGRRRVRPT